MDNNFLVIEKISKSFGNNKVLENINLNISKSEFFGLLGSSGSGKTTLLRIIGGFETPDTGKVYLDGVDITNLEPFKRPLNYMFQSYALFPHLNVFNNLAFGIKEDSNKEEIEKRVQDISTLLSIDQLLNRRIKQLSGGEQQRVALGRCLIKKPKLLLLDEPLAALDKKLRSKTQLELTTLQKKLKITFVFVTHDQEEALTMSDRIAVINLGKVQQIGTPIEIYEYPKNEFVAKFVGNHNVIYRKGNKYAVRMDKTSFTIATNNSIDNATVSAIEFQGNKVKISAIFQDQNEIQCLLDDEQFFQTDIQVGVQVHAEWQVKDTHQLEI